jgi:hypothetical protein
MSVLRKRNRFAWFPTTLYTRASPWLSRVGWAWLREVTETENFWYGWVAFKEDQRA